MPKAAKRKWYAVRMGWDGPKIYETWEEVRVYCDNHEYVI